MTEISANSPLKDSGERKEFETGATREITGDKGRFDLMPMLEIGNVLETLNSQKYAPIFQELRKSASENTAEALESAVLAQIYKVLKGLRDFASDVPLIRAFHLGVALCALRMGLSFQSVIHCEDEYTHLFYATLLGLAKHFENGALKYSERNWEKGLPLHCFIDSALRHLTKYVAGWIDEPHLYAYLWNIICAQWMLKNHPELNDFTMKIRTTDIGGECVADV